MTLRLVVATGNPDKAARDPSPCCEQSGADVELVAAARRTCPTVEETATTLVENARLKAEALRDATGLAALGDDTGLEVDALGGAPGVYSARYAGEDATYADNVAKLLARRRRGAPGVAHRPLPHRRSCSRWPDGSRARRPTAWSRA